MYEQDIELTRLLLGKLTELDAQGEQLRSEISQCRSQLDESQLVRDERDQYVDVLTRAAQLLERNDLEVESPEVSALELQINELTDKLQALDQEVLQYRKLVDELRERAPNLLAAATEEQPVAEPEEAYLEEEPEPEVDPESPFAEAAVDTVREAEDEAEPDSAELDAEADLAAAEDLPPVIDEFEENEAAESDGQAPVAGAYEREIALDQLFDLKDLKVKEAFTYGLGAAYIVDATSVLDRVPNYDQHFRALQEDQIRDQLIGDLDRLSREISGDFYVVFISTHEAAIPTGTHVFVEHAEGDGSKEAADMHIVQLVRNIVADDRVACVVTGDAVLAENVRDEKVHVIPLGEFFNT